MGTLVDLRHVLSFPDPVDERAARTVAAGGVVMAVLALAVSPWLLVPLVYGFLARVAAGPTLSPLGQLATKSVVPRLGGDPRPTPGPPKRFAQAVGAAFATAAVIVWMTAGWGAGRWVLVPLLGAAFAEAALGFCVGCRVFGALVRGGIIPSSVCEECANLGQRHRELA